LNLTTLRKDAGLSQEELALRLERTQQTVAAYEHGTRKPRPPVIRLIAITFNITLEQAWSLFYDDKQGDHSNEPSATAV